MSDSFKQETTQQTHHFASSETKAKKEAMLTHFTPLNSFTPLAARLGNRNDTEIQV